MVIDYSLISLVIDKVIIKNIVEILFVYFLIELKNKSL